MSGAPRQDLFTHIHKALRHGLLCGDRATRGYRLARHLGGAPGG